LKNIEKNFKLIPTFLFQGGSWDCKGRKEERRKERIAET
jgi:hypothetical protein